jgi:hypothetical protein
VARSAGEVRQVDDGLSALPTMERGRHLGSAIAMTLAQAMADNSRHSLDSTTVRGHVSAAGAKAGLANKILAVRGAISLVEVHCLSDAREASRSSSTSRPAKQRTRVSETISEKKL